MSERIVSAAMMYLGVACTLPAPARHGDIIHALAGQLGKAFWPISGLGGFITSSGRFVDRKEGMLIARAEGQTTSKSDTLYTEDLW